MTHNCIHSAILDPYFAGMKSIYNNLEGDLFCLIEESNYLSFSSEPHYLELLCVVKTLRRNLYKRINMRVFESYTLKNTDEIKKLKSV